MWRKYFLACFLLASSAAFGQFIQITGTVQDNIGLPYANGTVVPVLNISGSPTLNGQPYTPPQQPFGVDVNGKFAFNLAANNQLQPGGSTWSFIICSGPGTVSIAWGRQSACFQVNTLTLNSAQDITAQISTSAQPLTYSASFLAAASPTCPLTDGIVDLDFSNQDLAHRASVQASVLGSQVAVGVAVFVPGSQCRGVVQVATGLVVPLVTDNTSTLGDFITSSSITRGQVHDYGNTVSSTTRTYGQVIQANTGPGTISMVLYTGGGSGGGGGGGGSVGNCPINGGVGWYQFAGTVIGCNVNLTADSLGNLTALGYFLNGTGTLDIESTTYSGGLPGVCDLLGTCLSFDTNGILNGSINGGAWFPYLNAFTGVLWNQIIDRDTTGVTDFSRFFDLLTNINCAQPFVCVGGGSANSGIVNSSTITDDLTNPVASPDGLNARTQGFYGLEVPANASTGVGQFLMGCDDGSGALLVCNHTTSTTNVPAGVVEACNDGASPPTAQGCGTTGNAIVSAYGFLTVKFDNTATALHYAQQSSTVDGELSDVGATAPTNGQPFYFIWIGNAGSGTAGVIRILTGTELAASSHGGAIEVQTNGVANASQSLLNLVQGSNVTITNTSGGNVQISATGGISSTQIATPTAPTLANQNAAGARSITYKVSALEDVNGVLVTAASTAATIANANASPQVLLSAYGDTLYGADCYDVYVTADSGGRGALGKIAHCVGKKFVDTGAVGDSTTPPSSNNTLLIQSTGALPGCNIPLKYLTGPDAQPCSPTALDEEMRQTFGAPGDSQDPFFTKYNFNSASAQWTGGTIILTSDTNSGNLIEALTIPLPATPFTFEVYVSSLNINSPTTCGLGLAESTTNHNSYIGFLQDQNNTPASNSGTVFGVTNTTSASITGVFGNVFQDGYWGGNSGYLKVQDDGTTLRYSFSNVGDGINFKQMASQPVSTPFPTNAPTLLTLVSNSSSNGTAACSFDFVRRIQ